MPQTYAVVRAAGRLLLLVAGCTARPTPEPDRPASSPSADAGRGCGPLDATTRCAAGRRVPADETLDRFANDHAVVRRPLAAHRPRLRPAGRRGRRAAPPGSAASTATRRSGSRCCRIERVDLRTGRRLAELDPVAGAGRRPADRRAAGTAAAWPSTSTGCGWPRRRGCGCSTRRRSTSTGLGVCCRRCAGSFALIDDDGPARASAGAVPAAPAQVDWFDTDALVASSAMDLTPTTSSAARPRAVRRRRAPCGPRSAAGRAAPWFAPVDHPLRGAGRAARPPARRSSPAPRAWTWPARTRCGWSASPAPGTTRTRAGGPSYRRCCGSDAVRLRRAGSGRLPGLARGRKCRRPARRRLGRVDRRS